MTNAINTFDSEEYLFRKIFYTFAPDWYKSLFTFVS